MTIVFMFKKLTKNLEAYLDISNLIDTSKMSLNNARYLQVLVCLLLFFTAFNYISNGIFGQYLSKTYDYELIYNAGKKIVDGNANKIYDEFLSYGPDKSSLMFMYPAVPGIVFAPLSLFEYNTAKFIMLLLTQAFVLISFLLLLRNLGPSLPRLEKIIMFFMFFNYYPSFLCFYMGQSEFFLLAFFCLFFYHFQKGNDIRSAFFLSLVIYFKIFPIFFLLYFLWKKEYRYSGILFAMLSVMGLLSLLVVDFQTQKQYFLHILPFQALDSYPDHQCITGFFSRIFTSSQFTAGWIHNNFLKDLFVYSTTALVLFFTAKATRQKLNRGDERYKYEFSILIVIMLLLSRITDTHHFVFLLIPFSYLLKYYLSKNKIDERAARDTSIMIFCYAVLATYVPIIHRKYDWDVFAVFMQGIPILVLSVQFYVLVIFWLLCLRQLNNLNHE
ncbi:MAG: hypothetical protein A2297_00460 [Elusimicrobia bacterium RIFOXYB2_FULL_48_7]|nr:MAG: hypothetical protein A2297_00460 [Elusimicrobia bacterium RIFOXYB2_FULL_48_7]